MTVIVPTTSGAAAITAAGASRGSIVRDYLELSKSRIVAMVLITTAAGYLMGTPDINALALVNALIGTALVAAGTNALNQYVERDLDGRMHRTRRRPLPAGRIGSRAALIFSAAIAVIGTAYLAIAVNWLTALLGALTLTAHRAAHPAPLDRPGAGPARPESPRPRASSTT